MPQCPICRENPEAWLCPPCGHIVCAVCAQSLSTAEESNLRDRCIHCRQPHAGDLRKIFLPSESEELTELRAKLNSLKLKIGDLNKSKKFWAGRVTDTKRKSLRTNRQFREEKEKVTTLQAALQELQPLYESSLARLHQLQVEYSQALQDKDSYIIRLSEDVEHWKREAADRSSEVESLSATSTHLHEQLLKTEGERETLKEHFLSDLANVEQARRDELSEPLEALALNLNNLRLAIHGHAYPPSVSYAQNGAQCDEGQSEDSQSQETDSSEEDEDEFCSCPGSPRLEVITPPASPRRTRPRRLAPEGSSDTLVETASTISNFPQAPASTPVRSLSRTSTTWDRASVSTPVIRQRASTRNTLCEDPDSVKVAKNPRPQHPVATQGIRPCCVRREHSWSCGGSNGTSRQYTCKEGPCGYRVKEKMDGDEWVNVWKGETSH
ncbi:hypothetical protein ABKN59_008100 [Abortiporus biennis]